MWITYSKYIFSPIFRAVCKRGEDQPTYPSSPLIPKKETKENVREGEIKNYGSKLLKIELKIFFFFTYLVKYPLNVWPAYSPAYISTVGEKPITLAFIYMYNIRFALSTAEYPTVCCDIWWTNLSSSTLNIASKIWWNMVSYWRTQGRGQGLQSPLYSEKKYG